MLIIKMCYQSILVLFILLCSIHASIVSFLPTTSFYLPLNFKDRKLPCSKNTVVFPDTIFTPVTLESETSVSGFILPQEGDITLNEGTILFGADDADVNCTQEGNVYYVDKAVVDWAQPNIWSSPRFNDATPDAERIPCFDDVIEFPSNASFALRFPDREQTIKEMKFDDYTCTDTVTCIVYIRSHGLQQKFIFNYFFDFGLNIKQMSCQSRAGCPCQTKPLKIKCESKYCPVPKCVYPIKPEGHCCNICGGVINFEIDETFDFVTFKKLVDKTVESYGADSLIYHLGRLPNDKVQVVVIEKGEYSGTSSEVVNAIDHRMQRHWVQGAKFVGISGSPLDKSGLGGKIFISTFVLIIVVLSGIYIYYYKLPAVSSDIRFPILHRDAPGVFSRFQSRTDSVVCLTRRDSETAIGRSAGTAFRNPLYDSTTQREELDETGNNQ